MQSLCFTFSFSLSLSLSLFFTSVDYHHSKRSPCVKYIYMYNIFSLSLGFSLSSINISICMSFCQILQLTFPLYCLDFGSVSLLHNAKKRGIRTEAHQYDVVSFMPLILTFLLLHPMCHHITIHHSPFTIHPPILF